MLCLFPIFCASLSLPFLSLHAFAIVFFFNIYVSKLENDIVMIFFPPRKNIDNPIASSPSSSTHIVSSFFLGFFY
jgi:hypothetical protein